MSRHPWLLVFYLLAVTFAAFLLPPAYEAPGVAALIALQYGLLAAHRRLDVQAFTIFGRLRFLVLFLVVVNALLPAGPGEQTWVLPALGWTLNLSGMLSGLMMSAQIALVVLTTYTVRSIGDESSFIDGLRSLRVAPLIAYSLDTTMMLLGGSIRRAGDGGGGGGGRGDGSGGGAGGHRHARQNGAGPARQGALWHLVSKLLGRPRGTADEPHPSTASADGAEPPRDGVPALFRALRERDLSPFFLRIEESLGRAAQHAEKLGLNPKRAHDVGVIAGIAATMMAFKLVKVLPGLPVMQGAKTIFFIPMYILAADRTHSRWGGTIAGGILGFLAFLNGDSRYGIFEILKHLVPGLAIDLLWPLFRRLPHRLWKFVLIGSIAAAARTSTQFAMILALGADNATFLVFPALKLVPNTIAGVASALVSYPLVGALGRRPAGAELAARPSEPSALASAAAPPAVSEPRAEPPCEKTVDLTSPAR